MAATTLPGGTFTLAADLTVTRMGYGAMQLAVLRAAVTPGITHIDTADFYGRHVASQLIKEALYPYPDVLHIVTKVGVVRDTEGGRQRLRPGGHQLRSRSTRSRNWRVATGGWHMYRPAFRQW